MKNHSEIKSKIHKEFSDWILKYDKNLLTGPVVDECARDLIIECYNDSSNVRKKFHDEFLVKLWDNISVPSLKKYYDYNQFFRPNKFEISNLGKNFDYDNSYKLFRIAKSISPQKNLEKNNVIIPNEKKVKNEDKNKTIQENIISKNIKNNNENYNENNNENNNYYIRRKNKEYQKENIKTEIKKNDLNNSNGNSTALPKSNNLISESKIENSNNNNGGIKPKKRVSFDRSFENVELLKKNSAKDVLLSEISENVDNGNIFNKYNENKTKIETKNNDNNKIEIKEETIINRRRRKINETQPENKENKMEIKDEAKYNRRKINKLPIEQIENKESEIKEENLSNRRKRNQILFEEKNTQKENNTEINKLFSRRRKYLNNENKDDNQKDNNKEIILLNKLTNIEKNSLSPSPPEITKNKYFRRNRELLEEKQLNDNNKEENTNLNSFRYSRRKYDKKNEEKIDEKNKKEQNNNKEENENKNIKSTRYQRRKFDIKNEEKIEEKNKAEQNEKKEENCYFLRSKRRKIGQENNDNKDEYKNITDNKSIKIFGSGTKNISTSENNNDDKNKYNRSYRRNINEEKEKEKNNLKEEPTIKNRYELRRERLKQKQENPVQEKKEIIIEKNLSGSRSSENFYLPLNRYKKSSILETKKSPIVSEETTIKSSPRERGFYDSKKLNQNLSSIPINENNEKYNKNYGRAKKEVNIEVSTNEVPVNIFSKYSRNRNYSNNESNLNSKETINKGINEENSINKNNPVSGRKYASRRMKAE